MNPLFAQTTHTINGIEVSEGKGSLFFGLVVIGLISLRIIADRLDRARIRSHVGTSGGQVTDITWSPFGRGWAGDDSDRIYEVTYLTKRGKKISASCKTSMFSGVYWMSDKVPEGFDDADSSDAQCLSCGMTIPENQTRCPKCGWSYKDDPPKDAGR